MIDLKKQIDGASSGEIIVYYTGELGRDADFGRFDVEKSDIAAVRDNAFDCYKRGLVNLVQRKVGEHKFEYIAQVI